MLDSLIPRLSLDQVVKVRYYKSNVAAKYLAAATLL